MWKKWNVWWGRNFFSLGQPFWFAFFTTLTSCNGNILRVKNLWWFQSKTHLIKLVCKNYITIRFVVMDTLDYIAICRLLKSYLLLWKKCMFLSNSLKNLYKIEKNHWIQNGHTELERWDLPLSFGTRIIILHEIFVVGFGPE